MDAETGRVIYEKDAYSRSLIASTTKIMTALVVCEQCNVLDRVRIPKEAVGIEGSSIYLKEGEVLTVQELLYGMMLHSGNDAAVALAIYCGGTVEGFAQLMNDKAYRLGLTGTHFENPNGLDSPGHYSSARDLAVLTAYAMQNPEFKKIVSAKQMCIETIGEARKIYLNNHNKLLSSLEGCDGIKTGFTKATGRCLVSSVTQSGLQTVCVTLNAPNDWEDHRELHTQAHSEYKRFTLAENGTGAGFAEIIGGVQPQVRGVLAETVTGVYKSAPEITSEITIFKNLHAPIHRGQTIGKALIQVNAVKTAEIDVIAERDVPAVHILTYAEVFMSLLRRVYYF